MGTVTTEAASSASGRWAIFRRLESWAEPRAWVGDIVLALLVAAPAAASSVGLLLDSRAPRYWAGVVWAAVVVLHVALAGRRTWPRATFVVVAVVELVLALAPDMVAPAGVGGAAAATAYAPILLPSSVVFLFALYAVAAYGRSPAPGVALAVGVIGAGVATGRLAQSRQLARPARC